jgi:hypothetical protein
MTICKQVGLGQSSRYSDLPLAGRSGERIPVMTRFFSPFQTDPCFHLLPTRPSVQGIPPFFHGGKPAGAWRWPSSADVKERVQLYIYFLFGPPWPVFRRTLHFYLQSKVQCIALVVSQVCGSFCVILCNKMLVYETHEVRMYWECNTGRLIMHSGITKFDYMKTVGQIFTKPLQIEGKTQIFFFPSK